MTKFPFFGPERQAFYETYAAEYRFDQSEPTPWMPLRKDLRSSKLGIISTSGVRTSKSTPFVIDERLGSAEFRALNLHDLRSDYVFDFRGFDGGEARRDLNVLIPLEALIDLAERRLLRELDERVYSFVGHCEDLEGLRASAAEVAAELYASEVDLIFLFTASHLCNQTAGLLARELEKKNFSTLCLVSIKEVAHEVRIPRSVFVNFPFGMLLGPAGAHEIQSGIVRDMLHAMRILEKPGRIVDLPYRWEGISQ